jgi:hypothetical protein
MFKRNCPAAAGLLCCAAVLTLAGCSLMTPEWHPRRASASECPMEQMHACVIDNYGKRCGCASKRSVEVIAGSQP